MHNLRKLGRLQVKNSTRERVRSRQDAGRRTGPGQEQSKANYFSPQEWDRRALFGTLELEDGDQLAYFVRKSDWGSE